MNCNWTLLKMLLWQRYLETHIRPRCSGYFTKCSYDTSKWYPCRESFRKLCTPSLCRFILTLILLTLHSTCRLGKKNQQLWFTSFSIFKWSFILLWSILMRLSLFSFTKKSHLAAVCVNFQHQLKSREIETTSASWYRKFGISIFTYWFYIEKSTQKKYVKHGICWAR